MRVEPSFESAATTSFDTLVRNASSRASMPKKRFDVWYCVSRRSDCSCDHSEKGRKGFTSSGVDQVAPIDGGLG